MMFRLNRRTTVLSVLLVIVKVLKPCDAVPAYWLQSPFENQWMLEEFDDSTETPNTYSKRSTDSSYRLFNADLDKNVREKVISSPGQSSQTLTDLEMAYSLPHAPSRPQPRYEAPPVQTVPHQEFFYVAPSGNSQVPHFPTQERIEYVFVPNHSPRHVSRQSYGIPRTLRSRFFEESPAKFALPSCNCLRCNNGPCNCNYNCGCNYDCPCRGRLFRRSADAAEPSVEVGQDQETASPMSVGFSEVRPYVREERSTLANQYERPRESRMFMAYPSAEDMSKDQHSFASYASQPSETSLFSQANMQAFQNNPYFNPAYFQYYFDPPQSAFPTQKDQSQQMTTPIMSAPQPPVQNNQILPANQAISQSSEFPSTPLPSVPVGQFRVTKPDSEYVLSATAKEDYSPQLTAALNDKFLDAQSAESPKAESEGYVENEEKKAKIEEGIDKINEELKEVEKVALMDHLDTPAPFVTEPTNFDKPTHR